VSAQTSSPERAGFRESNMAMKRRWNQKECYVRAASGDNKTRSTTGADKYKEMSRPTW